MFERSGGVVIALRENQGAAAGLSGYDPVGLAIEDRAAAEAWVVHLDELGIEHSPIIDATIGCLVVFKDPDGLEHHLYTIAEHNIDQSGRAGYGTPTGDDEK